MSASRGLCLTAFVAAFFAGFVTPAAADTLSVIGASSKVCQLTGETDWLSGQPTAARTLSNFGLDSVDLGFPVDSGPGGLYLLFGDAFPIHHPPGSAPSVPPDDALGFTTRTAPPDLASCLDMQLITAAPHVFADPTVTPKIQQGSFNVPSGGIFLEGRLYAFFWTNHCTLPGKVYPDPLTPLKYPPVNATCPQIPLSNAIGTSVLASADPSDPVAFHQSLLPGPPFMPHPEARMPSGFVYVTAALPPEREARFPFPVKPENVNIPVFGVARYRASIPYLAMAPLKTFGDPLTWTFFAGWSGGSPVFVSRQQWESGHAPGGQWMPPPGAELYPASPAGERCVGEHSVTWNGALHSWLLLYNCEPWTVEARTAPEPWGPWSAPTVILQATPTSPLVCTLINSVAGCPNLRNYWPGMPGIFYAPFTLNRYTHEVPAPPGAVRAATIYWLLSTWNPYDVVVMQSTLAIGP